MTFKSEVTQGARFEFGKNWSQFLRLLNEDRIKLAEESYLDCLKLTLLKIKPF